MTALDTLEAVSARARILPYKEDRELVVAESERDPHFAAAALKTLSLPDGERLILNSAKKAVVNEMNPTLYPETRGRWNLLRESLHASLSAVDQFIRNKVDSMTLEEKLAELDRIRKSGVASKGLGQWDAIGSIVGAVAGIGASLYTSHLQSTTQKQIASMQLNAQMAEIQAQANMTKAQTVMNPAGAAVSSVGTAVSSVMDTVSQPVMGIPLWMIALGLFFFAEKA